MCEDTLSKNLFSRISYGASRLITITLYQYLFANSWYLSNENRVSNKSENHSFIADSDKSNDMLVTAGICTCREYHAINLLIASLFTRNNHGYVLNNASETVLFHAQLGHDKNIIYFCIENHKE